jgi:hypothetical protein
MVNYFYAFFAYLIYKQSIKSPVERLLSQSDEIVASQKANSQEYSEMTKNLAMAWEALKSRLKERQKLLNQAVTFYTQCQEVGVYKLLLLCFEVVILNHTRLT